MKEYFKAMSKNILNKEVIGIFILGILTFVVLYGALITYMPFMLHQKFDLPSPQIGMLISLASIASVIIAARIGKLTAKFESLNLLKTAFFLYTIVNLAFPFIDRLYLFVLPVILFGTAQALNMPSMQPILTNMAPDKLRGAFMSLYGISLSIGQTLGPLIIGIGYSLGDIHGAYLMSSFISAAGLIILFTLNKNKINVVHHR